MSPQIIQQQNRGENSLQKVARRIFHRGRYRRASGKMKEPSAAQTRPSRACRGKYRQRYSVRLRQAFRVVPVTAKRNYIAAERHHPPHQVAADKPAAAGYENAPLRERLWLAARR